MVSGAVRLWVALGLFWRPGRLAGWGSGWRRMVGLRGARVAGWVGVAGGLLWRIGRVAELWWHWRWFWAGWVWVAGGLVWRIKRWAVRVVARRGFLAVLEVVPGVPEPQGWWLRLASDYTPGGDLTLASVGFAFGVFRRFFGPSSICMNDLWSFPGARGAIPFHCGKPGSARDYVPSPPLSSAVHSRGLEEEVGMKRENSLD